MAGERKAWKRLRISNLLKLALIFVTLSGLCLFFMVHQIENPFIKQPPLLKTSNYQYADLQRNHGYVHEIQEQNETANILENDDAFFKDLHNLHINSSQQNGSLSQAPSLRKYKFSKQRRSSRSKRVSNRSKIKLKINFGTQNVHIPHFGSHPRLPNDSRSFSDDHRQLPESQSDTQRKSEAITSSRQFIEDGETFRQRSSDSEIRITEMRHAKANDVTEPKKAEFEQAKPFESNSESREQNTDKSSYSPAKTSDNSTSNNTIQDKLSSTSTIDVSLKGAIIKTRSFDTQGMDLNQIHETNSDLKRHSNKVVSDNQGTIQPNITNDLRDSDYLPKASSEKEKYGRGKHSSKLVSSHQGKSSPKITKMSRDSDQIPKASSKKVTSDHEIHSSKVVSSNQGKTPPKITNNPRDSDHLPKASSEKRKSLLIFGDDRSGTTFVTKMFAADPQMFTVYEPLWVTKKWFQQLGITNPSDQTAIVADVVKGLLSCKFTHARAARKFLAYTNISWVGELVFEKNVFKTSPFIAKTKSGKTFRPNLYNHPKFAEDVCLSKFKHSVVKVGQVRVPRESISVFIPRVFRENPDTDVRVIQIVRDPRGSINSRIRSGWISDFTFLGFPKAVKTLCHKITTNIKFGRELKSVERLKERYMEITYREIATMPITTAKKMYKFAGFEMSDSLIDWIVSSTNPDKDRLTEELENPFSHIRDSSKNFLKWRKESPIKRVRVIEQQCKELLDLLGLEAVADEMETLCS